MAKSAGSTAGHFTNNERIWDKVILQWNIIQAKGDTDCEKAWRFNIAAEIKTVTATGWKRRGNTCSPVYREIWRSSCCSALHQTVSPPEITDTALIITFTFTRILLLRWNITHSNLHFRRPDKRRTRPTTNGHRLSGCAAMRHVSTQ